MKDLIKKKVLSRNWSFNEIADQYSNDPDRGQALADIILQNETLSQIRIPTNGFEDASIPEKIKAAIGINPEADSLSIAEIFSYAGGKPLIEEAPTPPEDVYSEPTGNLNTTLTDAKTVIDNMTEPNPVVKAIGDKINSFVANLVTFDPPRFGSLSGTRPESTATTQDFLALLSEEEQEEFNRLVNSPK